MEHRFGSRFSISTTLPFYRNGHYIGRYRLANFSMDGLALHQGLCTLTQGEVLDIALQYKTHPKSLLKASAKVIHLSDDICGLFIVEGESDFYDFMDGVRKGILEKRAA